jgi:hypothetical protein
MVTTALPCAPASAYTPLRASAAELLCGRRRYPVELELLPWSSTRAELGLRPLSTRTLRFPSDAMVSAGHLVLRHLGELMSAWADRPLRDLTAELEALRTSATSDV